MTPPPGILWCLGLGCLLAAGMIAGMWGWR